ncbi:MAG TPA: NADH-ubiquinone oxidoreductase-F iron-sulfur binding region domain-containing protein, partial [Acidimicrobiia bacterium]|nr:NADH-ubiquinone oxidoreductase-F iron-sulfur binding region domain-containing protein [Acidimicrobiia bacterium]
GSDTDAPPTLVDNAETLAHVTVALAEGADWFREVGTDESPGTVLCTVSGNVNQAAVGEFPMGTPLREIIETLGGGTRPGRTIRAVLQGAAAAIITADQLDTPASWEGMQAIGSGLGAAAFIVLDDATDIAAVAASVSRFLAVESCGQCTPCKQDSLLITDALTHIATSAGSEDDLDVVRHRIDTVAFGARCSLATQEQVVVGSFLDVFGDELEARVEHHAHRGAALAIVPMVDLRDGVAVLDDEHARKQPDWTYAEHWSGKAPADRLDDHRSHHEDL